MISDFRHNPFTNVSTATTLTETHIIPHTSPYIITLGEVPQKDSPSTMSVKEVILPMTDPVTYGATFSEVAATPSTGEYFPDYNTGANNDKTWNTGKILFSANDAGKVVEITYTATGTLASVKANHFIPWWTDRGDGSDGIFHPTADVTISGEKNYTYVYIPEGVTVTVAPYALFKVQGAFINYGKITATGKGAKGGKGGYTEIRVTYDSEYNSTGTYTVYINGDAGENGICSTGGAGGLSASNGRIVASNIGAGGTRTWFGDTPIDVESIYLSVMTLKGLAVGSGGGGSAGNNAINMRGTTGGDGGGAVVVVATSFYNLGTIEANGGAGLNSTYGAGGRNPYGNGGGGGGGGGAVTVIASNIKNSGNITAKGGAGGTSPTGWENMKGAAGGDGIVILKELGAE